MANQKVSITKRSVQTMWALSYDAAKEKTPWMGFVNFRTTDQLDGERFGMRQPGNGVVEKGVDLGAFQTPVYAGFHVPNREWTLNRTIPRQDVEHNRVSRVQDVVDEMTNLWAIHPADLVETLILGGEDTYLYELSSSEYYFSTSHARGIADSGSALSAQSNLYSGDSTNTQDTDFVVADTSAPTSSEWEAILFAAAQHLMEMTNFSGRYTQRHVRGFTVLAGSTLWSSLLRFLSKDLVSNDTNIANNNVEGISFRAGWLPNASNQDEIYVAVNGEKAMLLQALEGESARTPKIFGPGTEHYDIHEEMLIKSQATYNVAFGHYQYMLKIKLTATS